MWFIKQSSEFTNMGANCYFYSLRNLVGSERPMWTLLLQQNNHSLQTLVAYIYMDVIILVRSRRLYHFMIIIRILIFRHNLYYCVRLVLQPMDLIMNQTKRQSPIYRYIYIYIYSSVIVFVFSSECLSNFARVGISWWGYYVTIVSNVWNFYTCE